jgi:hypothetical protein
MLQEIDGFITHARIAGYCEPIDRRAAAGVLIGFGHTPAIALAISTGALLRRRTTVALAAQVGLIVNDARTEARIAGLIQ